MGDNRVNGVSVAVEHVSRGLNKLILVIYRGCFKVKDCDWRARVKLLVRNLRKMSTDGNRWWFFQIIKYVIGEYFQYCYISLNNSKASNQSFLRLQDNGNRSMTPVLWKHKPENKPLNQKVIFFLCMSSPEGSIRLIMVASSRTESS